MVVFVLVSLEQQTTFDPLKYMMKIKYRIKSFRPDESPLVYEEPTFEGASLEECDAKAKQRLEEITSQESNQMDNFSLQRIDVEEVTTHIADNMMSDRAKK